MPVSSNAMGYRQWFILYIVVCLEVGFFLTLVPWSPIWERNYFLNAYPGLGPILLAPSVRGAVVGLGLANIYMGLSEVLRRRRGTSEGHSSIPENPTAGSREEGRAVSPEGRGELLASEDRR